MLCLYDVLVVSLINGLLWRPSHRMKIQQKTQRLCLKLRRAQEQPEDGWTLLSLQASSMISRRPRWFGHNLGNRETWPIVSPWGLKSTFGSFCFPCRQNDFFLPLLPLSRRLALASSWGQSHDHEIQQQHEEMIVKGVTPSPHPRSPFLVWWNTMTLKPGLKELKCCYRVGVWLSFMPGTYQLFLMFSNSPPGPWYTATRVRNQQAHNLHRPLCGETFLSGS